MSEPDWNTLIADLSSWNNGKGVDVSGWLSATGNFQLACAYSTVFWPRFVEHDGMILREGNDPDHISSWLKSYDGNKTTTEWVVNHIHLVDMQYVGCPDATRDRIVFLGHLLKEIYECKLAVQFPGRKVVVEFDDSFQDDLFNYQLSVFTDRSA
jgi:hypothetical protein